MAKPYSLALLPSILSEAPDGFLADLTRAGEGWTRSIRAQGGYWQGTLTLYDDLDDLKTRFYSWLGTELRELTSAGITWHGMGYELDLVHGGLVRRRSLDTVANRVKVIYNNVNDARTETAWATQDLSIARYGQKDEILYIDQASEQMAVSLRDRTLEKHAWPSARVVGFAEPGETALTIVARGHVQTMNFRYVTQTTENDYEQGVLRYTWHNDRFTFEDNGQNFHEWETTEGEAQHSIWVTNKDYSLAWGYLGAAYSNSVVYVYRDAALTQTGWNGANSTKSPNTYYVRGPATEWLRDVVQYDCEYVGRGVTDANYLQINRMVGIDLRSWDALSEIVAAGDVDGNPWRMWVDSRRLVNYQAYDAEPVYFLKDGGLYSSIGTRELVNPWSVRPAVVVRDLSYPVSMKEQGSWFQQSRDFFVEEVEVSADGSLTLRTPYADAGDLLPIQLQYWGGIPASRWRRRKKDIPLQYRDPRLWYLRQRQEMRARWMRDRRNWPGLGRTQNPYGPWPGSSPGSTVIPIDPNLREWYHGGG